jgi:hypothetical protein
MQSKIIRNKIFSIFCVFVLSSLANGQETRAKAIPELKFSVLSVRAMTKKEKPILAKHYVGSNDLLVTKFRVENTGPRVVSFYIEFPDYMFPYGYFVKKSDTGIVWLVGGSREEEALSPGLRPMSEGIWTTLYKGMAVEWEDIDESSGPEESHARTLFAKVGSNGPVTEVFSEFYKVPAKNNKGS